MNVTIFNGSPHKSGITDVIINNIIPYIPNASLVIARDILMKGCTHCGYCMSNTMLTKMYTQGCCSIATELDTITFTTLLQGDSILWVAPIYFYHMPSIAKAVIDRSQALYYMQDKGENTKILYPILHAGREKGKKLFESSLLTLTYFAKALGFSLGEALLLRGTDSMELSDIDNMNTLVVQYCKQFNIIPCV